MGATESFTSNILALFTFPLYPSSRGASIYNNALRELKYFLNCLGFCLKSSRLFLPAPPFFLELRSAAGRF
jgi:hypothetical protein